VIGSTRQVSVYAYTQPADMRKSFDGLAALVTQGLGRDPLSGDLFLFVARNRKRAKVLLFDGTGVCVYAKRLEARACRFTAVWTLGDHAPVQLTMTELQLFLEGTELTGRWPLSPAACGRVTPAVPPDWIGPSVSAPAAGAAGDRPGPRAARGRSASATY
jgi:transposase